MGGAVFPPCYLKVKSLSPTLWNPVGCSPSGSSVQGILQARVLEWVAISSSRGSSQPRDRTCVSRIAGSQTMVELMKIMVTSFRKSHAHTATLIDPNPYSRPPPTHTSTRDSQTHTGMSGTVSFVVTAPFSWVLVCTRFCCALQESISQFSISSGSSMVG